MVWKVPRRSIRRDLRRFLSRRTVVLWVGIALIVLMCLVPPWVRRYTGTYSSRDPIGYHLLFRPPSRGHIYLDTSRLVVQCFAVALLTAGVLATPWVKKKLEPDQELPEIKPRDM